MRTFTRALITIAMLSSTQVASAQNPNPTDQDDESSRQIVLDRFNKARPLAESAKGGMDSGTGPLRTRPPVYRRTGAARLARRGSRPPVTDEIGVTVWRLRPARANDEGARVPVTDGLKQGQWIPERIESGTPLSIGERVRISVESPRPGFLYIVDREQYADGSLGEPMLIFPTLRTRGGDNRVLPGKLIDIPAQEDQYPYFTATPTGDRRDQVAEVLSVILSPTKLPVTIGDQPLKIGPSQFAEWDKLWGGLAETLELVDGAGRTWTNEEKAASAANGRQLTQSGPPPQTVYRVAVRRTGGPMMITVPLQYGR